MSCYCRKQECPKCGLGDAAPSAPAPTYHVYSKDLTEGRIRELASMEVRRLLGSPHAFTALADRVVALERFGPGDEQAVRDVVREEMEEVLEHALGTLLQALLAGKMPQYREVDPLDG